MNRSLKDAAIHWAASGHVDRVRNHCRAHAVARRKHGCERAPCIGPRVILRATQDRLVPVNRPGIAPAYRVNLAVPGHDGNGSARTAR
jgi:hypothetical protein